jgi:outer membrane protein TolC
MDFRQNITQQTTTSKKQKDKKVKSKKIIPLIFFLISTSSVFAQKIDTLNFNQFKKIIFNYHPVALQANLLTDFAKAKMGQARGEFDPKLSVNFDQKEYNGTSYYRFLTPEVKLPLWYGLELKANYSEAEGAYINPENKLPKDGLSFLGLNMSLGKGLLMDKRRAAIKKAQLFNSASKVEQLRLINDLMLEAGEAYLNWQNDSKIAKIYENALQLAQVRYDAVKASLLGGDRPAIDTLEMLTQLQQRQIQVQQANLNLKNSFYELSSFLWLENSKPYPVDELQIIPKDGEITISALQNINIENNPKLLSYNFKLKDLQIDRRLKAENLRPTFDVQLGVLNGGTSAFRNINAAYWQNNNKIGVQFAFPLTFQSARADLAEAKLKILDTQYEQFNLKNELIAKLNQNQAEAEVLKNQLRLIEQALNATKKLLETEELKFRFGDSSLFLVNARESKVIEVNEKWIETTNKLRKNKLKAQWLSGNLDNQN